MPAPRLPADLTTSRVHAALRRLGFQLVREGKHSIFQRGSAIPPVPRHATVSRLLLLRELRRLGVTCRQFLDVY